MRRLSTAKYEYWGTEERWTLYAAPVVEENGLNWYVENYLLENLGDEYKKYISVYSRKTGLSSIAILDACSESRETMDDFVIFPYEIDDRWIQEWILDRDGECVAIAPFVDEVAIIDEIETNRSLLLIQDEVNGFIIYSPLQGEIDDYLIKTSTKKLLRRRNF